MNTYTLVSLTLILNVMINKKYFRALSCFFLGANLTFANYVEVFFEGTIDTVYAGTKEIGGKIKGSFRYEFDAKGQFPSPSITYPLQTNFGAFPLSMSIDGNSLSHPYGTSINLVDWSEESREDFNVSSDGYLPDGFTNVRMACNFKGPDLFDNLFTLPKPPKFTNLSLARFSFSISTSGNPNASQNYSGVIDSISSVVHPEGPEVHILEVDEYSVTVLSYGTLQHSYDLNNWTDSSSILFQSGPVYNMQLGPVYTYTFFEGTPKNFFVRAIK